MDSMRVAVIDSAGPPESFRVEMASVPVPSASDVVIRQAYAALNFGDVIRRKRGLFAAGLNPPYVLGFEGAGTVSAVGSDVQGVSVGDRVAYLAERGGYAEYVAVSQHQVWKVPDSVTDESAAGITCVGMTAWGLMVQSGVRAGDVALVHGAAGGVGSILVQVLALQGVRTVALVTGEEKKQYVSGLGVDDVVDQATGDAQKAINAIAPVGVNAIFDCVGQEAVALNVAVIKPGGTWMYFGSTSGHALFPGDRVLMNHLSLKGFVVFDLARNTSQWREGTAFLASCLAREYIAAQTTQVLPFERVADGHRMLENRTAMGKIILDAGAR